MLTSFPTPQWAAVIEGDPLPHPPRPTLITDFYSYNTDLTLDPPDHPSMSTHPGGSRTGLAI